MMIVPARFLGDELAADRQSPCCLRFNLYVNGNLIDESTDVQSLNENDVITTIGAYKEALIIKYHVDGIIDDVAIFNVALTQDDIESILRTGLKSAFAVSPTGKLSTTWTNIKQ